MPKLSKETLTILKNFSAINPSLFFGTGHVIRTIDHQDAIFARAELDFEIPNDFAVADLAEFLRCLSHFVEPFITFKKDRMIITEGAVEGEKKRGKKTIDKKNTLEYHYSDPSVISYPNQDRIEMPSVDIQFRITTDDFTNITKVASGLKLDKLEFEGTGTKINLVARSSMRGSKPVFSRHIGETNRKFKAIVFLENFHVIPASYIVEVSAAGCLHFIGDKIEYWLAVEQGSSF